MWAEASARILSSDMKSSLDRSYWVFCGGLFLLVSSIAFFAFRYDVVLPGPTEDTRRLVRLDGSGEQPLPNGDLKITTVSVRSFNPVLGLRALFDPAVNLVRRREPGNRAGEVSTVRMGSDQTEISKQSALIAAVIYLSEESSLSNRVHEIEIDTGDFQGPSAGLMLALGTIDRVGGGDLTRGRRIAGTGVISPFGVVTEVGGIAQKVRAAENANAQLFLVPVRQAAEAERVARRVHVLGVRDLADALYQLRETDYRHGYDS